MENRDYLESFRKQIDTVDNEIMILLKRRFQLSKKIAKYKMNNDVPIEDLDREKQVFQNLINLAISMQMSQQFVKKLFTLIVEQSKEEQDNFLEKKGFSSSEK